jgi:hypothetical protein
MPPRTGVPTPGASLRVDRVHVERKVEAGGAVGRAIDGLVHHAAQAALIDVAHGEGVNTPRAHVGRSTSSTLRSR